MNTQRAVSSLAGTMMIFALFGARISLSQDLGWPRQYTNGTNKVILYQPQIVSWDKHEKMAFAAALEVTTAQQPKPVYGILEAAADTQTNVAARSVLLSNLQPTGLRFPEVPADQGAGYAAIVNSALPSVQGKTMEVSLDRVTAYLQKSPAEQRPVDLNLDPPAIFYSSEPAILVIFGGKPSFKKVGDTGLLAAVNTNWDIFLDPSQTRFYLLDGTGWLTSTDPKKGPWAPAMALPEGLSNLPADPNWEDVRKHVPGAVLEKVPKVFVSANPAELILTDGEPVFSPIEGTKLMEVTNTDNIVFQHMTENQFYFQVAGRWFRAKSLQGPWTPASNDLPADFAAIPDESDKAVVKATVPGTQDAMDAVLLANVPQKTVVNRGEVECAVTYDGAPKFEAIPSTPIEYALNTPNDVFLADGAYYCCYQGMWFSSAQPAGPWILCNTIPQSIYTIPSNHPKHNVTYVYVYETTPETVQVGYTAGYTGEFVAATGVVMFGLGMVAGALIDDDDWDDDDWDNDDYEHYYYHAPYASYGCGAVYDYGYGGYYRSAQAYGPYGGAGRAGYYNPSTGAWARGGYRYGPAGSASAVAGYNPFTDTYAARAGVQTEYGSAGRFYAERGNEAVWGGHRSTEQGSAAWAQNTAGGRAVHTDTDRGQSTVAQTQGGDVYVGHDGNIYKKDESGWSTRDDGQWQQADVPAQKPGSSATESYRATSQATSSSLQRPTTQPTSPQSPSTAEANRQRPTQRPATPSTTEAQRPQPTRPTTPSTSDLSRQRPTSPSTRPAQSPSTQPSRTRSASTSQSRNYQQQLNRDAQSRSRGNVNAQRASTPRPSAGSSGSRGGGSRAGGSRGGGRGR